MLFVAAAAIGEHNDVLWIVDSSSFFGFIACLLALVVLSIGVLMRSVTRSGPVAPEVLVGLRVRAQLLRQWEVERMRGPGVRHTYTGGATRGTTTMGLRAWCSTLRETLPRAGVRGARNRASRARAGRGRSDALGELGAGGAFEHAPRGLQLDGSEATCLIDLAGGQRA